MILFALLSSFLCFAAETSSDSSILKPSETTTSTPNWTNPQGSTNVGTKEKAANENETSPGIGLWLFVGGLFVVAIISLLIQRSIRNRKAKEAREEAYMFKNDSSGPKKPALLVAYPEGFNTQKSFGTRRTNASLKLAKSRSFGKP